EQTWPRTNGNCTESYFDTVILEPAKGICFSGVPRDSRFPAPNAGARNDSISNFSDGVNGRPPAHGIDLDTVIPLAQRGGSAVPSSASPHSSRSRAGRDDIHDR